MLPPVQTLVATLIFGKAENANESPAGSDPTAAGGRRREGSEWQWSARDEGALSPRTFAGNHNRITFPIMATQ